MVYAETPTEVHVKYPKQTKDNTMAESTTDKTLTQHNSPISTKVDPDAMAFMLNLDTRTKDSFKVTAEELKPEKEIIRTLY